MKDNNPFDRLLDRPSVRRKTTVADSAPQVVDMLELAWAGVRAVFENKATPEHAFMLLPHLVQAAEAERQSILRDGAARMGAEAPPPAARRKARP